MDKTLKLHALPGAVKSDQLEGEKKSLELLKTVEQLRASLQQEQAKTAELEARINKLVVLGEEQLARKNALLAEEKKKSLEQMSTIEQLREVIKRDQASNTELDKKNAELQAKTKEVAALEAKIGELSAALNKISAIAAAGRVA